MWGRWRPAQPDAGFKLDSESQRLDAPTDPRTANVFDPTIRGKTDQFIPKFRKP